MAQAAAEERPRVTHPVDRVPPGRLAVYGFQHVLAFCAGAIMAPILLASAIAQERATTLVEISRIANLRLRDLVEEPVAAGRN